MKKSKMSGIQKKVSEVYVYASDTGTGSFKHLCMDLCQTEYDRCDCG